MNILRLFKRGKSKVKSCACVAAVCENSYFHQTDVHAAKNKQLYSYPIVKKAVNIIVKHIAKNTYTIKNLAICLNAAKSTELFTQAFVKDTHVALSFETLDLQNKTAVITMKEVQQGGANAVKLPIRQLHEIIDKHTFMQLEMYYETLQSFYKSSKVAGALLPANSDNPNSISFTINEQTELADRLEKVFNDIRNHYNIISLTVPFDYVSFQRKFSDLGLLELKTLMKEDLAACFDIPSLLLENNENSTYNNLSESRVLLNETLHYYLVLIQQMIEKFVENSNLLINNKKGIMV